MANVTVGINSKFNSKGVDDSKKALEGLKKSLTSINTAFKNAFNADIVKKAKSALEGLTKGSLDVYKANQKAMTMLTAATQKNAKLSKDSLKNITDFTNKLSDVSESLFTGSELQGQAAFLTNLSLTEEQIKNTLKAAVELSSSGVGNLESNIKNLAKTYGGLTGELGESLPFLKTLTQEQLKAGAAIDAVNEKYAGFAKTLAQNTMEGKENRFSSAIASIQNGIGSAFTMVKSAALDEISPILEEIAGWVNENAPKIGASLTSYVRIVFDIVENIKDNFDALKKPETWNAFFAHANSLATSFVKYLAGGLKDTFINAAKVLQWALGNVDIMKILWTPFTTMFGALGEKLEAIPVIGDQIFKNLRLVIEESNELIKKAPGTQGQSFPELGFSEDTKNAQSEFMSELKATFKAVGDTLIGGDIAERQKKYYEEALQGFAPPNLTPPGGGGGDSEDVGKMDNLFVEVIPYLKTLSDEAMQRFGEMSSTYSGLLENVSTEWGTVLKTMNANLAQAADEAEFDIGYYMEFMKEATDPKDAEKYYKTIEEQLEKIDRLTDTLKITMKEAQHEADVLAAKQKIEDTAKDATEIDEVINGAMTAGPMGALAAMIGQVVGIFSQIENVGKVLNPFSTILERVAAVLEPLLNELFAPFVIILESVGDIIGTVLAPVIEILIVLLTPLLNLIITIINIFKPILTIIMKLISLIITINPLLTIFNMIIEAIASVFVWAYNTVLLPFVNGLIWIFNQIQSGFVWLYNKISDVLYALTAGIVDIGHKSYNPIEKLERISTASSENDYKQAPSEEGYSGSGSYSAAKDVIVNIYFNHSFVNGDAREIALMLEDELEAAHALGY